MSFKMILCSLGAKAIRRFIARIRYCGFLMIVFAIVTLLAAGKSRPAEQSAAVPVSGTFQAPASEEKSISSEDGPWPFGHKSVCQSDPRLLTLIRKNYTLLPRMPDYDDPSFQSWEIPNISTMKHSKFHLVENKLIPLLFHDENGNPLHDGTYLESGSLGEQLSGTLYMERLLGWKGLIIEMVPVHLQKILVSRRHNSVLTPACVSPSPWPMKTTYKTNSPYRVNVFATLLDAKGIDDGNLKAADTPENEKNLYVGEADCFPMFSILLAANVTKIDFANLSFGGLESNVLETVPFDKVNIKVILFSLVNNVKKQAPLIRNVMLRNGYIQVPPELIIVGDGNPVYVRRDWAVRKKLSFV